MNRKEAIKQAAMKSSPMMVAKKKKKKGFPKMAPQEAGMPPYPPGP